MLKMNFRSALLGIAIATSLISIPAVWSANAETPSAEQQRLVIQVNKKDTDLQDHVLSNIVNLQKHFGVDNIEIEVVAYGPGIWFLSADSAYKPRIESLMLQNVVFTACGNTLDTVEAKEGKRPTLIEGVGVAQAGIARIMERQNQGWNYLSP